MNDLNEKDKKVDMFDNALNYFKINKIKINRSAHKIPPKKED